MLQYLIDLAGRLGQWGYLIVFLAVLGDLLVLVLLVVWLWRWATKQKDMLKQAWGGFLGRPSVSALRRRFAPQIAFVQARLAPQSYLGLQLTAGALLLIGASWLFGAIAEDVVTNDRLTAIDLQVTQWFHAHSTALITQAMVIFTHLHGPWPVTLYVTLIAAYLAWRRNWYWLIGVGLTVPLGMGLNILMKYAFHRARPSFDDPLLALTTYSFPSGHVAGATLFYGMLAAMIISRTAAWRWRMMTILAAIMMVAMVALTRVYLGVHYLSDVLAAFAEGLAWLALCLTGLHTCWEHRYAEKRVLRMKNL